MKKLLLTSILLLQLIKSDAQSWIYHPFPENGVVWRDYSQGSECCCSDGQYQTVGDTIISGR